MKNQAETLRVVDEMRRLHEENHASADSLPPASNVSAEASLLAKLYADITEWLEKQKRFFTNERDLQVKLAIFLEQKGEYDMVDTEYRVPLEEMQARGFDVPLRDSNYAEYRHFPWYNQISVDIVVAKDGKYALVELKYATRALAEQPSIFGQPMLSDAKILKNQAASNLTMYNYWKDVRRIEAIGQAFGSKITGGIALMVSNSRDMWTMPHEGAFYTPYSMHEGAVFLAGEHRWPEGVAQRVVEGYPSFVTIRSYECRWHDTAIREKSNNGDHFKYMINIINNDN